MKKFFIPPKLIQQQHVILLCVLISLICLGLSKFHNQVLGEITTHSKAVKAVGEVTRIVYDGRTAFRLTDGCTEAVVVPEIGRVMHYGFIGETNFLWNSTQKNYNKDEWHNWGGDKTWPAPQLWWPAIGGRSWPPDGSWDGSPHKTKILSNNRLQTMSEISPGLGALILREYWFEKDGNFVIRQIVEKKKGDPLLISIWNVTQIVPTDAIFVPLNPKSPYKQNFHWITPPPNESPVVEATSTLLQLRPLEGSSSVSHNNYKIGADSLVTALAAVKNGVAMVERASHTPGDYPDGAVGSGFSIEVYNQGDSKLFYNELELLSPLLPLRKGNRIEHTVRWSLQRLPSNDVTAATTRAVIEKLLTTPVTNDKKAMTKLLQTRSTTKDLC
ncbi:MULTISPECIES: hypothetical protein [Nostocales]|uniref:DUF4380 domain-containing protein n=3 Tax=Nostocales TaxID=1161 RepID=A0A0C1NHZ0_9CYAN|nr:hypothetical protein [Tolypothrix bouteillei]KAF3890209.1 hypothetical protein DA73_0400035745 [Tolypothrix bouteillei VB521301]